MDQCIALADYIKNAGARSRVLLGLTGKVAASKIRIQPVHPGGMWRGQMRAGEEL